jgi:hypothetical protein
MMKFIKTNHICILNKKHKRKMKEKEKNPKKYLHDLSFLESTKKLKNNLYILHAS